MVLAAIVLTDAAPARAASPYQVIPTSGEPLVIQLDQGTLVRLEQTPKSVVIANPGIADISIRSPKLMYVFGLKVGDTTMYAVDAHENVIFNITLRVVQNISRLKEALAQVVPGGTIDVESLDNGILLDGAVATPAEAEDARRVVSEFSGKGVDIINHLQVTAPNQVNLRVKVAEVSRSVVRNLGIDWNSAFNIGGFTFTAITQGFPVLPGGTLTPAVTSSVPTNGLLIGNGNTQALINALANEGLVTLLAEPNLTAISGETASFLAGGQFPIPVPQSSGGGVVTTVEFKNFGASLAFTPTIIGGGRINLRVAPEVTQLDFTNTVTISGSVIPSFIVRRATTTVELASGQSFAIGGLIQNTGNIANQHVPGLGEIPIIGELFNSDQFKHDETELIIIVTPYIVTPVSGKLAAPTDALMGPSGRGAVDIPGQPAIAPPTITGTLGGVSTSPGPQQSQTGGLAGPAGFGVE